MKTKEDFTISPSRHPAKQKSSGLTPGKPKAVAKKSRRQEEIPGDRGAREQESKVQGSE